VSKQSPVQVFGWDSALRQAEKEFPKYPLDTDAAKNLASHMLGLFFVAVGQQPSREDVKDTFFREVVKDTFFRWATPLDGISAYEPHDIAARVLAIHVLLAWARANGIATERPSLKRLQALAQGKTPHV
jgi:hypothetical protein